MNNIEIVKSSIIKFHSINKFPEVIQFPNEIVYKFVVFRISLKRKIIKIKLIKILKVEKKRIPLLPKERLKDPNKINDKIGLKIIKSNILFPKKKTYKLY